MLDLEAAICPRVKALAVTKVDSADHIRLIAEVVSELEAERGMAVGTTQFIAMIETAGRLVPDAGDRQGRSAHRRADARRRGLRALTIGMLPTAEALFMPKQQLAIAARAAGILPLGFIGTVADYKDLDAFRETVRRSRRLGFRGASVIHPAQIPILNEEFAPSADEVASARKIVAAYDEAVAAGRGSISVDGKMIDVPVVLRAQELLAIHDAIRERERRKQLTLVPAKAGPSLGQLDARFRGYERQVILRALRIASFIRSGSTAILTPGALLLQQHHDARVAPFPAARHRLGHLGEREVAHAHRHAELAARAHSRATHPCARA